jgi:MPBQ/MSBQ methyltransferase
LEAIQERRTLNEIASEHDVQNVTGINISEKELELCRLNATGCAFLRMDAAKLEFEDDSFDNYYLR